MAGEYYCTHAPELTWTPGDSSVLPAAVTCDHPECVPGPTSGMPRRPSQGRHTITFTADTSTLEQQLRIVAKHATSCADELAGMRTATSDDEPMRG